MRGEGAHRPGSPGRGSGDLGDLGGFDGFGGPGGFGDPHGRGEPDLTTTTTICLVRHGETDWNVAGRLQGREDTPLNARGRRQAQLSGQALRGNGWDVALTSPLCRATETARIIAERAGVSQVVVVPALIERDYGAASGLTRAEAAARFPGGVPGEEDRAAVRERSLAVLLSWVARYQGGRLLVVTHGGVIGALLAAASTDTLSIPPVRLHNACLNVLHHTGDQWRVLAHNMVDHLRGLDGPATDRPAGGPR